VIDVLILAIACVTLGFFVATTIVISAISKRYWLYPKK